LPKGLLTANPIVAVKALMMDEDGAVQSTLAATRTFTLIPQSQVADKLVLVGHDTDTATYLLYGHDLNQAKVIWPARNADPACPPSQLCLQPVGRSAEDATLKLLRLPIDVAKEAGSIVIQREGARQEPLTLAVPALPADAAAPSPAPTATPATATTAAKPTGPQFKERLVIGADEGTIVGEKLDSTVSATYAGRPLTIVDKTPTTLKISGLAATGASAASRTEDIVLTNRAGKQTKVPVEVVSSRVEFLSK
jgi:hypothetical protein